MKLDKFPPIKLDFLIPAGGLDLVTPPLRLPPGACRAALNFESDIDGGYTRIAGYERWAGQAEGSKQQFYSFTMSNNGTNSAVIYPGMMLQGATSGARLRVYVHSNNFQVDAYRANTPEFYGVVNTYSLGDNDTARDFYACQVQGQFVVDENMLPVDEETGETVLWYGDTPNTVLRSLPVAITGATANAAAQALDLALLAYRGNINPLKPFVYDKHYVVGLQTHDDAVAVFSVYRTTPTGFVDSSQKVSVATQAEIYQAPKNYLTERSWAQKSTQTIGGTHFTTTPEYIETVVYNFGSGSKIYGVSGAGPAWSLTTDLVTWTSLPTSESPDTPAHIEAHKNRLFLSFDHTIEYSNPGDPTNWSALTGTAGEINVGETIIKLQSVISSDTSVLLIYTESKIYGLYGDTTATFNLVLIASDLVVEPDSIQMLDRPVFMTDRGLTTLSAVDKFGNFEAMSISRLITPWLNTKRRKVTCSAVLHGKNQYRIFFEDGQGVYATIVNGKLEGLMPVLYDRRPSHITKFTDSTGDDVVLFAANTESEHIYRMDSGSSFDGRAIDAFLMMAFNSSKSNRVNKTYKKLAIDVQSEGGYVAFDAAIDVDYSRMAALPTPTVSVDDPGVNPYSQWDGGALWDEFYWDGYNMTPAEMHVDGTGENFALVVVSNSYLVSPFTIAGVTAHYIPRRLMR